MQIIAVRVTPFEMAMATDGVIGAAAMQNPAIVKRQQVTRSISQPELILRFTSLEEARAIIEEWRVDYNEGRPHSSLGYRTPAEFAAARSARHPQGRSALPLCEAPAQSALDHAA